MISDAALWDQDERDGPKPTGGGARKKIFADALPVGTKRLGAPAADPADEHGLAFHDEV
jgi:hypothetical protein